MSKLDVYDALALGYDKYKEVALNICGDEDKASDVVQMVMEACLKMPKQTLQDIYDKDGLLWYIIRMISLNIKSKTSRYYYKYNKYYELFDSNNSSLSYSPDNYENRPGDDSRSSTHIKLDGIDDLLNNLYWYDRELFLTYYRDSYTLDTLAAKTGISRTSIFNTLKKVRNYLKDNIKDNLNGKAKQD
jgi:RNA polymerase sigma factor (sigma-70 family)|tara:strand:+ start:783 stop:1346 length:564 start_codon:yes stop_codon:yes gene_type:complete